MSTLTDLRAAGARAATQPVTEAPSLAELTGLARQRRSRRTAAGGVAVVAALALVGGAAFVAGDRGGAPETVIATGPGLGAGADQQVPAGGADLDGAQLQDSQPTQPQTHGGHSATGHDDHHDHPHVSPLANVDVQVEIVRGSQALDLANEAAVRAAEMRVHDHTTAWIEINGDQARVSALVHDNVFVAATGPANQIDDLVDVVTHDHGSSLLEHDTGSHAPGQHDEPHHEHRIFESLDQLLPELERQLSQLPFATGVEFMDRCFSLEVDHPETGEFWLQLPNNCNPTG